MESVGKKARFLEAALGAAGLAGAVRVAATRAEELASEPANREAWPAVTARAVGSLDDLVELAFPLLVAGGLLVAWKRGPIDDERRAGQRAVSALGGDRLHVVHAAPSGPPELAAHRLVIAEKKGQTPPVYPRPRAERRRRPW